MPNLDIVYTKPNHYSELYIRAITKDCEKQNINVRVETTEDAIYDLINHIGNDMNYSDGILFIFPMSDFLQELLSKPYIIPDALDIDGMTTNPIYKPATAYGIFNYIKQQRPDRKTIISVIGRGKTVGSPLIKLLIDYGYTVFEFNSKSKLYDTNIFYEQKPNDALKMSDIVVGASSSDNILCIDYMGYDKIYIDTGHNFITKTDHKILHCGKWTRDIIIQRVLNNNLDYKEIK